MIVSEYTLLAVTEAASVTLMVTLNGLPVAEVGVPVIAPVLALMFNPAGKPVDDQVYEPVPPVAVTVVEGYDTPTVPADSVAGPLMARDWLTLSVNEEETELNP